MSDAQFQLQCRGWSNLSWKLRPHSFKMFWVNSQRCRLDSRRSAREILTVQWQRIWSSLRIQAIRCNPLTRACLWVWMFVDNARYIWNLRLNHWRWVTFIPEDLTSQVRRRAVISAIWMTEGMQTKGIPWISLAFILLDADHITLWLCHILIYLVLDNASWTCDILLSHLIETWSVIFCVYVMWSMWNKFW